MYVAIWAARPTRAWYVPANSGVRARRGSSVSYQEADTRSRRLLDALGATLTERFVEFGQPQVLCRLSAAGS